MVIPIIFLAFMLSAADSEAKIQAGTAHILQNINREKQALKYLKYSGSRFPQKCSDKSESKASGKGAQTSLEVQMGAVIPDEDYLKAHVVSGIGLTIPLKKRLSLTLDLGYWKSSVEEVPSKFYDGQLKAFPFLASLRFSLLRQNRVNPYAFLGGGYIFTSFIMKDIITIPEITIGQCVKNGPCLQCGLGIDVTISHTWGVFTEAVYFYRESTGITTITDLNFGTNTKEFPVNLRSWIFQIGIKYFVN